MYEYTDSKFIVVASIATKKPFWSKSYFRIKLKVDKLSVRVDNRGRYS